MTVIMDAHVPVVSPGSTIVPGYLAIGLISRGHRLDVYDAWSATRRVRSVVKIARPDRRHDPEVREDLLAEGRLLERLDHPHWVRVYEVVERPDPAVVLETIAGRTLAALLDDEGRLRASDAKLLGSQVAAALTYLHRQGWLHLDLTPGNVVVTGGIARVIDLSLARRPGAGHRGAGTTGYRAPEQRTGGQLTPATDVWGLGLLLHEALSGRVPGTDGRSDGARPLRRWTGRRRLPSDLVALVNAAIEDRPEDRPTIQVMQEALGGVAVPRDLADGLGEPA